jgi:hypothetical protein
MDLIVTSMVPGRRRGGFQFTGATKIDPARVTEAELKQILADPVLTLVYGTIVTDDTIGATLASAQAAAAEAAAAAKPAKGAKA